MAGLVQAGFIFLGFAILVIVNFLSIGLKKIEENWEIYRCNPLVMPIAGLLGKNPTENMAECIKNMQSGYMSILMQPIDMNFSILTEIASSITAKIGETMSFIDGMRDMIGSITVGMFGTFSGIMSGFALSMMAVRDIVSRLTATTFLLLYSVTSLLNGARSLWNGPPGQGVRGLSNLAMCFSPDSYVDMESGEKVIISNCSIGSKLRGGGVVRAVMELDNTDERGEIVEKLYNYCGGKVSGSHLVYDRHTKRFVPSRDYLGIEEQSPEDEPVLYCLITSNHIIPSGGLIFHDWEDNNGSASKSL